MIEETIYNIIRIRRHIVMEELLSAVALGSVDQRKIAILHLLMDDKIRINRNLISWYR